METKQQNNDTTFAIYVFIATCLGAFTGLLAYVKDWI